MFKDMNECTAPGALSEEQLELVSGGDPTSVGATAGSVCGHAGQDMLSAASSAGYKIGGSSGPPPLAPNPYQ